jgi:hypothetical protein
MPKLLSDCKNCTKARLPFLKTSQKHHKIVISSCGNPNQLIANERNKPSNDIMLDLSNAGAHADRIS